jgi:hypothetical protein
MKLSVLLSAVLAAIILCNGPARADVVTFDDLSDGGGGTPISSPYHGLNWTNFGVLNTVLYPNPSGYKNGTVSAPNVAYNENGLPASISGTSPFTFNSAYFTAAWNDGLNVTVVGKLGGVAVLGDSTIFTVDTSGPTLETFDWTNVDEVDFSSIGGSQHPGFITPGFQFVMDNMTINEPVASAPEPSSVGMALLLGLGVLGAARRWRLPQR